MYTGKELIKLSVLGDEYPHPEPDWAAVSMGPLCCPGCHRIKREELFSNPIDVDLYEIPKKLAYSRVPGLTIGVIHEKLFEYLRPYLLGFCWGRVYLKGVLLPDYRTLYSATCITIRAGKGVRYFTCPVCGKTGTTAEEYYVLRKDLSDGQVFQDGISALFISDSLSGQISWGQFRRVERIKIAVRDDPLLEDPYPGPGEKRPIVPESYALPPNFRFHTYLLGSRSVVMSENKCVCCRHPDRDWMYVGPVYGGKEYDESICPWCIEDGRAHRELGVTFVDIGEGFTLGDWSHVSQEECEELTCRTPGFTAWQQPLWPACCGHPSVFIGRAGYKQLSGHWAAAVPAIREACPVADEDWPHLLDAMSKDASPTAYVFQCGKCWKLSGFWDCD